MQFRNFLIESTQEDIKSLCGAAVKAYNNQEDFVTACAYLADFVDETCRNYEKAETIRRHSLEKNKATFLPILERAAETGFVAFNSDIEEGAWDPSLNTAIRLFARMPANYVLKENDPLYESSHFSVGAYAIIRDGVINDCIYRQMSFDEWSDGEGMSRYAELSPDKMIIDLVRQSGYLGAPMAPTRDREQIWLNGSWQQELIDALKKGATNTLTIGDNIRNTELSPSFWSFIIDNMGIKNNSLKIVNDLEYFYV
jgi:hypothetical protein